MLISSQENSRLPKEYREVLWLRGTGTQYCRLSYAPRIYPSDSKYSSIRGDITVLDINSSELAIMADDVYGGTVNGHTRFGIDVASSNITFDYGFQPANKYKSYSLSGYGTAPLDIHYELNTGSPRNIMVNENTYNLSAYDVENMSYFNAYLIGGFYNNLTDITIRNNNTLIKAFSIYQDGELVSDIIPCYRKSDNKAGFYETGSDTFLVNLGTGSDWLIGPNV